MVEKHPGPHDAAFGFRSVDAELKQGLVNDIFADVARRYDDMNDLMSAGLHRLWKDDLVTALGPPRSGRAFHCLDVAGGTGDIAQRILAIGGTGVRVTLCDISPEMIAEGKRRARNSGIGGHLEFAVGNAEALPFPDGSFDGYTIAFGIRNVTDVGRALAQAYRVLKPGGRFACLEFSRVDAPGLKQLYDAYSLTVIPALGKAVTGNGAAYRYLVESIRMFPDQRTFAAMIEDAGFGRVHVRDLTGGIAAIHTAWRL